MPHFQPRARIDARLWPKGWGEPPTEILGPAAQRMLAILASGTKDGFSVPFDRCTDGTEASPLLRNCPIRAPVNKFPYAVVRVGSRFEAQRLGRFQDLATS